MKRYILGISVWLWCICTTFAVNYPVFSTAGFFQLENSGRQVFCLNPGWRFVKADVPDARESGYDDSGWEVVALPHGLEYLPEEASGCVNYQGIAWYQKRFTPDQGLAGERSIDGGAFWRVFTCSDRCNRSIEVGGRECNNRVHG